MTDKLSLFNGGLRLLGERKLASLSENREPRRILDDIWDDGAVDYCLEQGQWRFAMRTVEIPYDPDFSTPDFGYQYAFSKPDDYVRTAAVCTDEFLNNPLTEYTDEAGFWFANIQTIYVQYVSNDPEYGGDYSLWPETFVQYVQSYLANEAAPRILQNDGKEQKIEKKMKKSLVDARSKDALNQATKFPPPGTWSGARRRGLTSRRNG